MIKSAKARDRVQKTQILVILSRFPSLFLGRRLLRLRRVQKPRSLRRRHHLLLPLDPDRSGHERLERRVVLRRHQFLNSRRRRASKRRRRDRAGRGGPDRIVRVGNGRRGRDLPEPRRWRRLMRHGHGNHTDGDHLDHPGSRRHARRRVRGSTRRRGRGNRRHLILHARRWTGRRGKRRRILRRGRSRRRRYYIRRITKLTFEGK